MNNPNNKPYLSGLGAWALAFGCAVGWGAFVMPGNVFLPKAGPLGAALGLGLGALVMLVIARNYSYLIKKYPGCGGAYTYTKECFGYDHGFLTSWFLLLTYVAVIWANATALPLIARAVFPGAFQFGFHYQIAGFDVYLGELLLVFTALAAGALVCMRRRLSAAVQIVMALLLLGGVALCFSAAIKNGGLSSVSPQFSSDTSPSVSTFTIFALAPWAYVGFESISHSAGEAKFPLKRSMTIMTIALVTAAAAYIMLVITSVTALPEGCSSWVDYIANLGKYSGVEGQPAFFGASSALGTVGTAVLGIAALGAIFTGIIGNYVALSRLAVAVSKDKMLPERLGKLDKNNVPRNALLSILAVSLILPFFGRTAISWIVDVTTVGATIAFTVTSAAALRTARREKDRVAAVFGVIGLVVSLLFAVEFLIPNLLSVQTLSTESYIILAAWGILGFIMFYRIMKRRDHEYRFGRSTVAWVVLLGLIIFSSSVWMRQSTATLIDRTIENFDPDHTMQITEAMNKVENKFLVATIIQVSLIVAALILLIMIYSKMQQRQKKVEVEKALAEETSRAKTSFLSNMSHEIRTPMNAIIGMNNITLRDPDLSPKTRDNLEKIGASAKHLLGLINDILDMSRIESGRMVLKDEEFLFREFLDQICIIIHGQCMDKGLDFDCRVTSGIGDYYVGDDMKLKQVIINILGNAVKFTEAPGNVSLTVSETEQSEDSRTLRFIIKDTGIGMDEEYIPKIFEAFSQEDATTTNKYGGSGLGMAITKNFVEMMGGTIGVESKKGVGTTFTVTVKLGASDRKYHEEYGVKIPEELRAAVVDNDEIACEHAKGLLTSLGVSADSFTSPHEALDALRGAYGDEDKRYKLLLTDYKMPEMNGIELIDALREFDNGDTAVIMLTGYNFEIIDDEAKRSSVDDIIAKPLFSDTLIKSICSVLDRKGILEHVKQEEASPEESENPLAGKMILMAEDIDANAEILADLLDLEDISSERAENGKIALEMFSSKPEGYYDAILMDVRMPVMDGLAATEAIRALDRPDAKTVPIIAMTANVFDEDVERSHKAGMNAHLSKPVEPDKLYETMNRLINENK
ncbi:MAG: amino acid permease [Clostridia bacterium]|nr:amino acid permease [Clostridia bacterium]